MPPNVAIDTHAHVFERGLAMAAARRYTPDYDATLAAYLGHLDAHGLTHGVLVQPSFLGTDNSYLVAALRARPDRLRGVAVLGPDEGMREASGGFPDDAQGADERADGRVAALAAAGVVGARLNLFGRELPDLSSPAWQRRLGQFNLYGWHVEVHAAAARLQAVLPPLLDAGCRVVVDHFGRPDPALGLSDPGFAFLLRQATTGRVWVKLAAPYRNWAEESLSCAAARALLEAYSADFLLWGSDWPHTEHPHVSYAPARRWLDAWIPDPAQRRIILADTPWRLFDFSGNRA